jgi:ankyrin repeat protein
MERIIDICKADDDVRLQEMLAGEISVDYVAPRKPLFYQEILRDAPPLCCIAAFFRSKKCLNYLIANSCDLKKVDNEKRGIVHFAAAGGSVKIIEFLMNMDLDWNASDNSLNTCAHYATLFKNIDAMLLLWCTQNIDLSAPNARKMTPLHIATTSGDVETIEFLCRNGCNVNSKNDRGLTPLHIAASKPNIDVVYTLTQYGANSYLADNTGLLPYQYASFYGFQHIQGYLLSC